MKFPHCQAENPEGVKFCGECGHDLAEKVPEPAKPPSTPQPASFAGGSYKVKRFPRRGRQEEGLPRPRRYAG
jgi:hypothetical protein